MYIITGSLYKKGYIILRATVIFGMGNILRYFIGPTNIPNNKDSRIEKKVTRN